MKNCKEHFYYLVHCNENNSRRIFIILYIRLVILVECVKYVNKLNKMVQEKEKEGVLYNTVLFLLALSVEHNLNLFILCHKLNIIISP